MLVKQTKPTNQYDGDGGLPPPARLPPDGELDVLHRGRVEGLQPDGAVQTGGRKAGRHVPPEGALLLAHERDVVLTAHVVREAGGRHRVPATGGVVVVVGGGEKEEEEEEAWVLLKSIFCFTGLLY